MTHYVGNLVMHTLKEKNIVTNVFFEIPNKNRNTIERFLGWYNKQTGNKLVLNLDPGVLCIFTNALSLKSCIKLL